MKGHTKEACWKIVGYPHDFKSRRKIRFEGNRACNAVLDQQDGVTKHGSFSYVYESGAYGVQNSCVQGVSQCSYSTGLGG